MAQKKDPYGRIKQRFIEERAEDKGWDELSVDQRQRLANRFDVLAASVEGRGKIARTILPDAPQERRKALRQRVRQNLPTNKSSTSIPEIPSVSSPAGRVGSPSLGGYTSSRPVTSTQRTTTTQTQAQSKANVKRGQWSKPGQPYQPSSFVDWAADVNIPGYSQTIGFGPGIPGLRFVRPASQNLDEAVTAFKQGQKMEGVKNLAEAARDVTFGALDVGASKFFLKKGASLVGRGASKLGRIKGVGNLVRSADQEIFGGVGQAATNYARTKFKGGKTTPINETTPVASTTERVVASEPAVRQATTETAPATQSKLRGVPRKVQPGKNASKNAKVEKALDRVVLDKPQTSSSPTKAPEVVPQTKVEVAGTTPPTEFQKTVTPEQFTAPATKVEQAPATAATKPVTKTKGSKKAKTTKTSTDVKIEFDDAPKVEPAKGTPAQGEVVGGAAPKAPQKRKQSTSSQTPSSSNVTEKVVDSSSKPTPFQKTQTSEVTPPASSPSVDPSKPGPSEQKLPSSSTSKKKAPKQKFTKAQLEEAKQTKMSAENLKVLREAPIERVEYVVNPETGAPVINPKTGLPAQRTIYVSEAKLMEQKSAKQLRRRGVPGPENPRAEKSPSLGGVQLEFDQPVTPAKKSEVKIEFDVEGVPTTAEGKAKMEQIRKESTVNPEGQEQYPNTYLGQVRKQLDQMAAAEAKVMQGTTRGRRNLRQRRKTPGESRTERAERISRQGTFNEKTGAPIPDTRSAQEIAASNKELLKKARSRKNVAAKPKGGQEKFEERQQLTRESVARQLPEEQVKQARKEARKAQLESKARKREQEQAVGERKLGKTGIGVRGRYGEVRARLRRMERAARARTYPKDVSQPLHSMSVNERSLKRLQSPDPADIYNVVNQQLDVTPLPGRRGRVDYADVTPDVPVSAPAPERPKGVEFFEMNPKTMDYEQLLAVEQAGFKLQVSTGAPTRFSRDRGVRGVFTRPVGEGMDPAQFKTLMKSTEFTKKDLVRLIKSTTRKS